MSQQPGQGLRHPKRVDMDPDSKERNKRQKRRKRGRECMPRKLDQTVISKICSVFSKVCLS